MNTTTPLANVPASTKQQAENLYLQMEANPGGGSDPVALRRIQTLALQLKRTSPLFSEKAGTFALRAEILYSPRKHALWNTPH